MAVLALQDVARIQVDIPPGTASASGGVDGVGVCIKGYDRAVMIGMTTTPDTSNSTFTWSVRVDSDCNVPSDCTYAAFSTDVTSSAMAFAATGASTYVSYAVIDVDLAGHLETGGCICTRVVSDGTETGTVGSVILLFRGTGEKGLQPSTGATVATSGRVTAAQTIDFYKFP